MEPVDEIVSHHNLTMGMLNDSLPEIFIDIPDHTLVDHHNKKLIKVSSYGKFAELCREKKDSIGNSELIVYVSPYLSLSDANKLGVSMGDLVCEGVVYKVGNAQILDEKLQRNASIVQKAIIAENLLSEVKARGRPNIGPDVEWFKLNRRYACVRYITSLMRTGSDKEVHDAIKACLHKVHVEIYGGDQGFDEWCQPNVISAERISYTQQKLSSLRSMYMEENPSALDPAEERKIFLSAQGQFTHKKVENELRGDLISLTRSFEEGLKHAKIELDVLNGACSLAGFKID